LVKAPIGGTPVGRAPNNLAQYNSNVSITRGVTGTYLAPEVSTPADLGIPGAPNDDFGCGPLGLRSGAGYCI
jgi:hypothetical protein